MLLRNSLLTLGLAVLSIAPACPHPLPTAAFSPNSLSFGPQVVGPNASPSASQTVTLSAGVQNLTITSISASGNFSETNNCPSVLAAKATCDLQVSFAPNAIGVISGAITLTSNAAGSPHIVSLTGTGLAPVGFSPVTVDFGSDAFNTTSAAQAVTLTNNQGTALGINSIGVTGDYSQTNNCPSSLAAGQTCQISIRFKPSLAASIPGALNVTTDASPDAQPVALTGVGTGSGASNVNFSSATLAFGNQEAGSSSVQKTVTVTNKGGTTLTIQSVGVSAGYTSADDCAGNMLSPGSTCSVDVKFQPQADFAPVDYPGAITVVDSDVSSPQVIGLSGAGVAPVTSAPASVDFGQVLVDSTSAPQTVKLVNNDAATEGLTLTSSGGYTIANSTCGSSLGSGATCKADMTVTTKTFGGVTSGPFSGALTITPSSGGSLSPQVVSLKACATTLSLTPSSFNFGAIPVGSSSAPETLTLDNPNGNGFNVSATTVAGADPGDFTITNNTCTSGVSGSCTMDVTYAPQASGIRSGTVVVTDDDVCSPHQQTLSGGSSSGPFTVYVNVGGVNASGTVISSPAGINCVGGTGSCSASFPSGTSVTLTATGSGSHLSGWGGACSGNSYTCVIDMTSDEQATATFAVDPQLIVMITGTGNGIVMSNPAVIDCEVPITSATNCVATFPPGASVTLTATAASGSSFTGWSGGGCSGTGTCTFASSADQTISAGFASLNPPDFSLSASALSPAAVSPGQSATSTLSVSGINGFSNSVALTCSMQSAATGSPRCLINPNSVAPGGNATLTASTTAPSSVRALRSSPVLLALCMPFLIGAIVAGSSRNRLVRSRMFALLAGSAVLCLTVAQLACGGSNRVVSGGGGTPPGNYTVTVTGTSGAVQHSTTLTLTVH